MEEKTLYNIFPRQSLYYLLLCGMGLLAFAAGILYPSYKNLDRLDGDIKNLKAQTGQQEILRPPYHKLTENLKALSSQPEAPPAKAPLPVEQVDELPSLFGDVAKASGMEMSSVVPDAKSMAKDSKAIAVRLTMKGSFFDFRKFLLALVRLPYVKKLGEIEIRSGPEGRKYDVKLWVQIGNS